MKVNPLASMACWPVEIELGGRTFEVPALPAVDWWPIVSRLDLMLVLDLIEDPDLDDAMLLADPAEMGSVLTEALEEVTGRSLHVTYVLAATADQHWMSISGELARRGFRWDQQPIAAALDAIYVVVTNRFQKQEDLDTWLALLDDESLTAPGKKRTASQKAKGEFESMAGPRPTSGVRSTGGRSGSARPRTRTRPRPPRQSDPSGEPTPRP